MLPDNGNTVSDESANAPNLAYTATPILGNMNFTISVPPTRSKVANAFPAVDYISIEAAIFFQSLSNPTVNPTNIGSGSNTGQQVVSGQSVTQDATGTSRVLNGTQLSS
jgi:hypothetical protein